MSKCCTRSRKTASELPPAAKGNIEPAAETNASEVDEVTGGTDPIAGTAAGTPAEDDEAWHVDACTAVPIPRSGEPAGDLAGDGDGEPDGEQTAALGVEGAEPTPTNGGICRFGFGEGTRSLGPRPDALLLQLEAVGPLPLAEQRTSLTTRLPIAGEVVKDDPGTEASRKR